jgi:hypothetical protein
MLPRAIGGACSCTHALTLHSMLSACTAQHVERRAYLKSFTSSRSRERPFRARPRPTILMQQQRGHLHGCVSPSPPSAVGRHALRPRDLLPASSTFAGLRSVCAIFKLCRCATAMSICLIHGRDLCAHSSYHADVASSNALKSAPPRLAAEAPRLVALLSPWEGGWGGGG